MTMSILEQIVAHKQREVAQRRAREPDRVLESRLDAAPVRRDFYAALGAPGPIKVIAEIKKASPSRGLLRQDFHPVELARCYESHAATAISVLTDETFFQGSLAHLSAVRQATHLPLLRKDFIIDRYQLLEARLAGADAVLLIAECLDDCQLAALLRAAEELGLACLLEFYEPENLPRVLRTGAPLVGINNRNLKTFQVDIQHTLRLRREIPDDVLVVSESGIRSRDDVLRLADAQVHAILVGEHLMQAPDPGHALDLLLGRAGCS
jgi:indole-3-glycerol phosphate synthase